MNTRIILSGLSIVAALSLVGAGAFAAFSSQNSNTGNAFGAGTLVLSINTQSPTSTGPINVTNAAPGVPHSGKLKLKNEGSVDASSVQVDHISVSGTLPGSDVTLDLFQDANDNGVFDGGETVLGSAHLSDGVWTGYTLPSVTLPAGSTYNLAAQVTLDSGAPNSDQGKSMTFDMVFNANQ